jgi:CHASE3 domain sensor protein
MKDKAALYNEALDAIRAQINRITYSNHLSHTERLNMLDNLEIDINRKLGWAKTTFSYNEKNRDHDDVVA